MNEATISSQSLPSKWSLAANWVFWLGLFALTITLLPEVKLAAEISLAASETYPKGMADARGLYRDTLENLVIHPPRQLARLLWCPSPRWRAVVCSTLGSQEIREHEYDWTGIAPVLVRVALSDPEPPVRTLALQAFQRFRKIPEQDLPAVVAAFTAGPMDCWRRDVLLTLAHRGRAARVELRKLALKLANSSCLADRQAALWSLALTFPDEPRVGPLLTGLLENAGRQEMAALPSLRLVLRSQPKLTQQLLDGTEQEKTVVLDTLTKYPLADDSPLSCQARIIAEHWLHSDVTERRRTARTLLLKSHTGWHSLTRATAYACPEHQAEILAALAGIAWARVGPFRFTKDEAQLLATLLQSAESHVQEPLTRIFNATVNLAPTASPFPPESGPRDPELLAYFRQVLDADSQGGLALLARSYLTLAVTPQADDIPRLGRYLRRVADSDLLVLLATRFPEHAETRKLATQILADSRSASRLVDIAGRFLLRFEDQQETVAEQLVSQWRQRSDVRSRLANLMLIAADRTNRSLDSRLAGELWVYYVRLRLSSYCGETDLRACRRSVHLTSRSSVKLQQALALVGTDQARRGLESVLRGQMEADQAIGSIWVTRFSGPFRPSTVCG